MLWSMRCMEQGLRFSIPGHYNSLLVRRHPCVPSMIDALREPPVKKHCTAETKNCWPNVFPWLPQASIHQDLACTSLWSCCSRTQKLFWLTLLIASSVLRSGCNWLEDHRALISFPPNLVISRSENKKSSPDPDAFEGFRRCYRYGWVIWQVRTLWWIWLSPITLHDSVCDRYDWGGMLILCHGGSILPLPAMVVCTVAGSVYISEAFTCECFNQYTVESGTSLR